MSDGGAYNSLSKRLCRAISITYVGNDDDANRIQRRLARGVKEVSLPLSGKPKPNVTIVNIGHAVTCSVTRGRRGKVRQHTGAGSRLLVLAELGLRWSGKQRARWTSPRRTRLKHTASAAYGSAWASLPSASHQPDTS